MPGQSCPLCRDFSRVWDLLCFGSMEIFIGKEGGRGLSLCSTSWGMWKGDAQGENYSPMCPAELPGGVCILCWLLHWGPFLQTKKTLMRLILSRHRHDMKVIFSVFISHTLEKFFPVWPWLYPSLPSCWRAWPKQAKGSQAISQCLSIQFSCEASSDFVMNRYNKAAYIFQT